MRKGDKEPYTIVRVTAPKIGEIPNKIYDVVALPVAAKPIKLAAAKNITRFVQNVHCSTKNEHPKTSN